MRRKEPYQNSKTDTNEKGLKSLYEMGYFKYIEYLSQVVTIIALIFAFYSFGIDHSDKLEYSVISGTTIPQMNKLNNGTSSVTNHESIIITNVGEKTVYIAEIRQSSENRSLKQFYYSEPSNSGTIGTGSLELKPSDSYTLPLEEIAPFKDEILKVRNTDFLEIKSYDGSVIQSELKREDRINLSTVFVILISLIFGIIPFILGYFRYRLNKKSPLRVLL